MYICAHGLCWQSSVMNAVACITTRSGSMLPFLNRTNAYGDNTALTFPPSLLLPLSLSLSVSSNRCMFTVHRAIWYQNRANRMCTLFSFHFVWPYIKVAGVFFSVMALWTVSPHICNSSFTAHYRTISVDVCVCDCKRCAHYFHLWLHDKSRKIKGWCAFPLAFRFLLFIFIVAQHTRACLISVLYMSDTISVGDNPI